MLLRLRSLPLRFLVPTIAFVVLVLLLAAAFLAPRANDPSANEPASSPGRATSKAEPPIVPDAASTADTDAVAGGRQALEVDGEVGSAASATSTGSMIAPDSPGPASPAPNLGVYIARTGSIELRIKRGSFERAWGDAQSVAAAFGGIVSDASRSGAGDGPRLGTLTLQVPSRRFDAAIERLREGKGATVSRLDISSEDVTQEYVDTRSRLRHNRAVEARLLSLLADTNGVSEVLAVQQRLDGVQEAIEVATGRLDQLKAMTTMSSIAVTLREPGAKAGGKPSGDRAGSTIGHGWADARERFAANVAAMVSWAGGAAPVLLLLALLTIAARAAWALRIRRSRSDRGTPPAQT